MSASATLLARLNELRVASGLAPYKCPLKIEAMQNAIAALEPKPPANNNRQSAVAAYARKLGLKEKSARGLLRRHFPTPPGGWNELLPEFKAKLDEAAERKAAA